MDVTMKIVGWIICSSIVNYFIITTIVDICLMGMLFYTHAPKVSEKRVIIQKKNRIDIQTGYQCSAYSSAYILRHYGIPAEGQEIYSVMPGKMKSGCVYPKGLRDLLKSYGFEITYCRGSMNDLEYEISKGNPVIAMILVQEGRNWLHYVPVVGFDEDYMYLAESLENFVNCTGEYYNRKVEKGEFMRLWNTAMVRQPFYKNTYFRIRSKNLSIGIDF